MICLAWNRYWFQNNFLIFSSTKPFSHFSDEHPYRNLDGSLSLLTSLTLDRLPSSLRNHMNIHHIFIMISLLPSTLWFNTPFTFSCSINGEVVWQAHAPCNMAASRLHVSIAGSITRFLGPNAIERISTTFRKKLCVLSYFDISPQKSSFIL